MKKIILDTNFIMDLVKFKIDIDGIENLVTEPYKFLTLNTVVDELRRISLKKSKNSRNARLALKLLENKAIEILACRKADVDEIIISLADEDTIVATNDAELRKRLKNLGIKTIYLRARKHLAIS